ncbi:hypothetical protein [Actinoplanes sp. NPDC020271]|uniref:hypothetical protein n=1 Tax=Actinoplanes sp. NPDC020271 TaxID=3363896 RepID=UPI00379731BF
MGLVVETAVTDAAKDLNHLVVVRLRHEDEPVVCFRHTAGRRPRELQPLHHVGEADCRGGTLTPRHRVSGGGIGPPVVVQSHAKCLRQLVSMLLLKAPMCGDEQSRGETNPITGRRIGP